MSKVTRKFITNKIGWVFWPATSGATILYGLVIARAAEENGIIDAFVKMLGVLASSYWGLLCLSIMLVAVGAYIALKLEDWLEARRVKPEAQTEAVVFVYADDENNPHAYQVHESKKNIQKWHITNPACRTFFLEFEDGLTEPVIEIFANSDELRWCDWFSTERYVFINFDNLPPNSWFVVCVTDSAHANQRRQGQGEIKAAIPIEYDIAIDLVESMTKLEVRKKNEPVS